MICSIQKTILAFAAPYHKLSCSSSLWRRGLLELNNRGREKGESGAFLLGFEERHRKHIRRFVFYDDLDIHCLERGFINFDGSEYGKLWELCRVTGLVVVADVHTHPGPARQSMIDQRNPMIAQKGHVGILVPNYAHKIYKARDLGVYEYEGDHRWKEFVGKDAAAYFYIGWGG
jgi:proteasome lid subunit RPN8/RPN11